MWQKVCTRFAMGFRKPKKVCTEFTCQFACNQNKFVLCLYSVCNWFAGSRKSSLVSLLSVTKVYTGTEMFTSKVTKQQKKFALLQNKFAFQPNKFAFWQNKFAFWQNKFAFWPKKVCILVNKFTTFIENLPKSLHKVNLVNLVNFSKKFTPFCPPMRRRNPWRLLAAAP